jgi:MtN3 and saliva related transmembrane protein
LSAEPLGLVAGVFTTFSLVPQLYRVLKLKEARQISLPFTLLMAVGNLLWLGYGLLAGLIPILFWNSISLLLSAGLTVAKLRYGLR